MICTCENYRINQEYTSYIIVCTGEIVDTLENLVGLSLARWIILL